MILDELSAAACTHVDLDWDALEGIGFGGLKVEVVLGTNFVPLVGLDTVDCSSTNEGGVGIPGWFEDTAAGWGRAAIAALLSFWVVQVTVSVFDILTARLRSQVVSESTISVIDTVCAIDAVH